MRTSSATSWGAADHHAAVSGFRDISGLGCGCLRGRRSRRGSGSSARGRRPRARLHDLASLTCDQGLADAQAVEPMGRFVERRPMPFAFLAMSFHRGGVLVGRHACSNPAGGFVGFLSFAGPVRNSGADGRSRCGNRLQPDLGAGHRERSIRMDSDDMVLRDGTTTGYGSKSRPRARAGNHQRRRLGDHRRAHTGRPTTTASWPSMRAARERSADERSRRPVRPFLQPRRFRRRAWTATSATLGGSVNPNGRATTWHFEYGTEYELREHDTSQNAGSGTAPTNVSATVSGLRTGVVYHFRLVAENERRAGRGAHRGLCSSPRRRSAGAGFGSFSDHREPPRHG